ncbi:MAG: hypothetical protein HC808_11775 [Candidatus Competibacteraceae bacterium]|nr:hypothetical protein [Candidatus Competibacteraceae bacterium]
MGGDEFLILVRDLHNAHDAGAVAQRILNALTQPLRLADYEHQCICQHRYYIVAGRRRQR